MTNSSTHLNSSPRETMRVLPSCFQTFLTWLTCKPLEGQVSWGRRPIDHLLIALTGLVIGVITSVLAVTHSGFWLTLLIPSWIATVSSARTLHVMIVHYCTHSRFSTNEKVNKWVGEVLSILLILRNYESYRKDHVYNHHTKRLQTLDDETVKFLFLLAELRPGMTREKLWRKFWLTLISPKFHWKLSVARVTSNLSAPFPINLLACLYIFLLLGVTAWTQAWLVLFLAWLFPMTVLYQISLFTRLCSEHIWPVPEALDHRDKLTISRLTVGIFLGEPTPDSSLPFDQKFIGWFKWSTRMLFIHLFSRLFIMVADTPCHDYHHRHPHSTDWANYIFARAQDLDSGCPGWPEPYTEVWGLYNAIDLMFESLSQLQPFDHIDTSDTIHTVFSPE
ncbi:fatty acid desaturase [Dolichospermum sp. FACHB-1091]|uniref:fatty acid desaturase n=1 Tax=Dolichospermum sp. FACHB-1091 TaxID=2692798 RepID=UPI00168198EF|nr:fatty acid desaturase [Dolichospermum sp. FACHB-1091]MBD2443403.1 fatty acid desaturase [Dolichospermum sp. FACHB-1091]